MAVFTIPAMGVEVPAQSTTIVPDATVYYGQLDTEAEEDWYSFTPAAHTLYRIGLNKVATGYTDIRAIKIYQKDDFDVLTEVIGWSTANAGIFNSRDIYTETDRELYIKVYDGFGSTVYYYLRAETFDTTLPDSYGDDLATATPLAANTPVTCVLTRTEGVMDEDWFAVDLLAGHQYQFNYTVPCHNAGVSMKLLHTDGSQAGAYYSDASGTTYYNPEDMTLMVKFSGNSTKIGELFEFTFVDNGLVTDDHRDMYPLATDVTVTAGQTVSMVGAMDFDLDYGGENYGGDIDWFAFTPEPNTLYDVVGVMEAGTPRKDIKIYRLDRFGALSANPIMLYGNGDNDVYIEGTDDVYVKVYGGTGGYAFEFVPGADYTDSYGDDINSASAVTVDTEYKGSIARSNPLDQDWLVFAAEPMHRYQVDLTFQSTRSTVSMRLYCNGTSVVSGVNSFEFIAHSGNDYHIQLTGDSGRFSEAYRFMIEDMGLVDMTDDHGNDRQSATVVPTDTTPVTGTIDYASNFGGDEDFFSFDAVASGDYTFTINGGAPTGYKRLYIYRVNDLDQLVEVGNTYSYYEDTPKSITKALGAGTHFLKVVTAGFIANYEISVESPEPRCGDEAHPYPVGDVSGPDQMPDCRVDMLDLAAMAANWLQDNNPEVGI